MARSSTHQHCIAGFFEDKEAGAKAHGIAPPKKKTKEEAYADFMTSIAADVKDVEEREQEEASRAAQDREAREAFEQRYHLLQGVTLLSASLQPQHLTTIV